ncbi:MAG: topoisomerase [Chitinophagaceae bacterium]|nr:topoisomerase [Chitinophagaceae bacterium]
MVTETGEEIKITTKKIKSIGSDPEKTAKAINLVYISDTEPGITRVKNGDKFQYFFKDKEIEDDEELLRIKHLVLPPAWTNVWICSKENGHLQATGMDAKGRKQYKYHPDWNKFRNQTKFYRLHEFGKVLPAIRLQLEKDLSLPTLGQEKVLAAVVSLMERTNIRVGNNFYEKLYGSYGLTTLKDKHVKIEGNKLKFSFKGKKGVLHDISIKNNKLSKIVKQCRDIPGKELFQYFDENGERHSIDSGMVNEYIKKISGGSDFTAKDFRTWAGTVQALLALKSIGCCDTATETKKRIVEALDIVSQHLGNTRTVCKKYYVHPLILSLYESNDLEKYTADLDDILKDDNKADLTPEEKVVMKILETN